MILTQEEAILKGQSQFQTLLDLVERALQEGCAIDRVEEDLWRGLLGLGRTLLQMYVAGQGSGDLGPTIPWEGRTLRRLTGRHERRYVSVFGELQVRRHVYGVRETQKHQVAPLDARLNLPAGEFSYLLQRWDQKHCVQDSYEESRASMQEILGIGQSVRSLEHMSLAMSQSVEGFRNQRPAPPAEEEGPILVMTADCKGVPMRRAADEPAPQGRLSKGQKANKKRMACVGSVYTIEPFVRTAEDVVNEVLRKEAKQRRPPPRHKQVRAELTRQTDGKEVNGKDRIFDWFVEASRHRNGDGGRPMVCLMDGERALWKRLLACFTGIVCILDIFHVLERLWQAAHCFHKENSQEAKAFVSERLKRILEGDVGRVIGGLKQMACKRRLTGSRRARLTAALTYLANNRRFMRYDEHLAAGYPIGSGVAEGACRYVVKDRMERTGMRWRTEGAQAVLDLRAVHVSDDWEAFTAYRVENEAKRLYPYRDLVAAGWNAATN